MTLRPERVVPGWSAWFIAGVLLVSALESDTSDSLEDALNCTGEWAGSALCLERKSATEQKAKIEALMAELQGISQPPWEPARFTAARNDYESGLEMYRKEFFGDASSKFEPALEALMHLQDTLETATAELVHQGQVAVQEEDYARAQVVLERIVNWPDTPPASRQHFATATLGVETQSLVESARDALVRGDRKGAANVLSEIPEGVWERSIASLRKQIADSATEEAFSNAMTRGYGHSEAGRWNQALDSFQEAARLKPSSVAARDATRETEDRIAEVKIRSLEETADQSRQEQDWGEAEATLRQLVALAPDNRTYTADLFSVERNLDMELRLDRHLEDPAKLASLKTRRSAESLVESIDSSFGTRIVDKASELADAITLYSTRIRLVVVSDGKTRIRFVPGQDFGKFTRKTFELVPGSYSLVGTRTGYREVSLRLDINPGDSPREVRVVCTDTF